MIDPTEEVLPPDLKEIDRFVKITEAAKLLGFSNYQSVNHLHQRGIVSLYSLPGKRSTRALLSEINALLEKQQSISDEPHLYFRSTKRKRGRPRKFI